MRLCCSDPNVMGGGPGGDGPGGGRCEWGVVRVGKGAGWGGLGGNSPSGGGPSGPGGGRSGWGAVRVGGGPSVGLSEWGSGPGGGWCGWGTIRVVDGPGGGTVRVEAVVWVGAVRVRDGLGGGKISRFFPSPDPYFKTLFF